MTDGIDTSGRGKHRQRRWIALAVPGLVWPALAMAQGEAVPVVSRPVVQQVGGHTGSTLSTALARLGRNPQDIEALIDAGNAALSAGDTDAAIGFFTRADRLSPGNPRIVAGLAGAHTAAGDGLGALPLFAALPAGVALPADRIADHGLADDLVGDNLGAQTLYLQALSAGAGDEARRRLAISLAISGDSRGSAAALSPLLQKQDRAAWRTRAFCLAILGQEEDAVAIAKAIMPTNLALGMAPYLRYMGRLTRAQQAAAANLGRFPLPSTIGIDDARVVAWQQSHGVQHLATASAPRAPLAAPQGARVRGSDGELPAIGDAGAPPPEPAPSIEARAPVPTRVASAAPATVSQPMVQPVPATSGGYTLPPRAPEPAPSTHRPSFAEAFAAFNGAPASGAQVPGAVDVRALDRPAPRAPMAEAPHVASRDPAPRFEAVDPHPAAHGDAADPAPVSGKAKRRHAEAAPDPAPVADAAPVKKGRHAADPAPAEDTAKKGRHGTDLAAAAPDDDSADTGSGRHHKAAKPVVEPHPSRVWVQVGIGRSDDRVAYDWKRMNKDEPKLFKGKTPSVTKWGATRRVLVGPFATTDAADAYAAKMKAAGHGDAFVWTSPSGQAVDPVDAN